MHHNLKAEAKHIETLEMVISSHPRKPDSAHPSLPVSKGITWDYYTILGLFPWFIPSLLFRHFYFLKIIVILELLDWDEKVIIRWVYFSPKRKSVFILEQKTMFAQWPLILCDPMDGSLTGFSVHGISQARILKWVAISFSRGSSQPRDQTQVSCTEGRFFTNWAGKPSLEQNGIEIQGIVIMSISMFPYTFIS